MRNAKRSTWRRLAASCLKHSRRGLEDSAKTNDDSRSGDDGDDVTPERKPSVQVLSVFFVARSRSLVQ